MLRKPCFLLVPCQIKLIPLLLASVVAVACFSKVPEPPTVNSNSAFPAPQIEAFAPLEISELPGDVDRCDRIKELVAERGATYEKWGLMVVSLEDGRGICGMNASGLFTPASIQKLLTSAVALEKLGADFSVLTSVYSKSAPANGKINGDLILYGRGAPDFGKPGMKTLVADLKSKGIKAVAGNIVGDESHFKGSGLGDGWTWNEAQWYYGAEASALSFEKNRVNVKVRSGKPAVDSRFVKVDGTLKPVESIEAFGLKRKLGTNEVYVWGNGRNFDARIAVSDPALFTARVFKERLERNGITVAGKAVTSDWTNPADLTGMSQLASVESEVLVETIREMNKDSVNIYAELMIRAIGKRLGAEAPDKDPKMTMLRGDDLAGAAYLKKWMLEESLASGSVAIHDGSGLSRLNRVSPEAVVRTLIHAAKRPYSKSFVDSLPVAGRDGTLRNRLRRFAGRVFAKTGSIKYANSLAGYLIVGDETLAFTIICNDETEREDSSATIDAIIGELMNADR